jgi:nicotinamidase-related amidase
MPQVIAASSRFRRAVPVLVMTDLQMEHTVEGRPYTVADAEAVVERCGALLDAARAAQIPVAHFRRVEQSPYFNPASALAAWVDVVRPWPSEMVFEHDVPSCYSCEAFTRFFGHVRDPLFYLAGFGANYTGIATAIDAFTRGHDVRFVADASGSYGRANHDAVCGVIAEFADLVDVGAALSILARRESAGVSA